MDPLFSVHPFNKRGYLYQTADMKQTMNDHLLQQERKRRWKGGKNKHPPLSALRNPCTLPTMLLPHN